MWLIVTDPVTYPTSGLINSTMEAYRLGIEIREQALDAIDILRVVPKMRTSPRKLVHNLVER